MQKRLHFFEVASDIAALQIIPRFRDYLDERVNTLELLGRANEATEFREISYQV